MTLAEQIARIIDPEAWAQFDANPATFLIARIAAQELIAPSLAKAEQAIAIVREEAAKVCEQQAQDFLSEQYATPQPIGSITERFACGECASAIRKLGSAS